jgi:hypothetical protein
MSIAGPSLDPPPVISIAFSSVENTWFIGSMESYTVVCYFSVNFGNFILWTLAPGRFGGLDLCERNFLGVRWNTCHID